MLTEIQQSRGRWQAFIYERPGSAREQDLAAMSGGSDPRRSIHVQSQVVGAARLALACVDAHPHGNGGLSGPCRRGQLALGLGRGAKSAVGGREDGEERVTLGAQLSAVTGGDGFPKDGVMPIQDIAEACPEPLKQPGRTFDVGEEEGDLAGGQFAHPEHSLTAWVAPIAAA